MSGGRTGHQIFYRKTSDMTADWRPVEPPTNPTWPANSPTSFYCSCAETMSSGLPKWKLAEPGHDQVGQQGWVAPWATIPKWKLAEPDHDQVSQQGRVTQRATLTSEQPRQFVNSPHHYNYPHNVGKCKFVHSFFPALSSFHCSSSSSSFIDLSIAGPFRAYPVLLDLLAGIQGTSQPTGGCRTARGPDQAHHKPNPPHGHINTNAPLSFQVQACMFMNFPIPCYTFGMFGLIFSAYAMPL